MVVLIKPTTTWWYLKPTITWWYFSNPLQHGGTSKTYYNMVVLLKPTIVVLLKPTTTWWYF